MPGGVFRCAADGQGRADGLKLEGECEIFAGNRLGVEPDPTVLRVPGKKPFRVRKLEAGAAGNAAGINEPRAGDVVRQAVHGGGRYF